MTREKLPHWCHQLETWRSNGTFDRLDRAMRTRQTVQVLRSNGTTDEGRVTGFGYAGRTVQVKLVGRDLWKVINTEDLLELNPHLGPHLKEAPRG